MRGICQTRAVWKVLLQKLDIEQAPDVHPFDSIEAIPDPELRRKVVSAVRRHQTWHDPGAIPPYRVVELPLPHVTDEHIIKTRLLPGGRELLLANYGHIELWSIETQECLLRIPPPRDYVNMVGFDFQLVDAGETLAIASVWTVLGSM